MRFVELLKHRHETWRETIISWTWAVIDLVILFLAAYLFWGGV